MLGKAPPGEQEEANELVMALILISSLKIIVGINCPHRPAKASLQHGGEGRLEVLNWPEKRKGSLPGAETSEKQGETLECRHFSALLFLGFIGQKR